MIAVFGRGRMVNTPPTLIERREVHGRWSVFLACTSACNMVVARSGDSRRAGAMLLFHVYMLKHPYFYEESR